MIPFRLALAGGWIDQPFVSRHDPEPPGSMVVVSLEPGSTFMDRSGMGTSTRQAAVRLWGGTLPAGDPADLVRRLYAEENGGKTEPSGSQDMAGIIYPGASRLDYDSGVEGGVFPAHVETAVEDGVVRWLEKVVKLVAIAPRPAGYNPLGVKNLDPSWVRRLGRSGRDCFTAILARDVHRLGDSFNECMRCWEAILPRTVVHPALKIDLKARLAEAQSCFAGAMYSGCGGGYLVVASEGDVPGARSIRVRRA